MGGASSNLITHFTFLRVAKSGEVDTLQNILDIPGIDINFCDVDGWTALMLAAKYGHSDIVKILIDKGASVKLQNSLGDTAISLALSGGVNQPKVVKLLIAAGAEVSNFTNVLGMAT